MVHHRQPGHKEVLFRAHIRVNFVRLVMPIMHTVLGLSHLEFLHILAAASTSLTVEFSIVVQLNVCSLQSILV